MALIYIGISLASYSINMFLIGSRYYVGTSWGTIHDGHKLYAYMFKL
jgi:hypothetical protein